jgi:FtsZ-binding cell division protein ZapB
MMQITGLKDKNDEINNAVASASKDSVASTNAVIGSLSSIYDVIGKSSEGVENAADSIKVSVDDNDIAATITTLQTELNSLSNDATDIQTEITKLQGVFGDIQQNPLQYMKGMAAFAGGEAFSEVKSRVIAAPLAKAFVTKHFGDTKDEADEKLKALGVVEGLDGLNFNLSTIFSEEEPDDIHIVVYYKMRILNFFDFEYGELVMCEESRARAWLGGDDAK